jgi:MOSC domain-containing protein
LEPERIGTLASLRRYPVKSMAGEELAAARVTFAGLVGDRVYAFVDENNKSRFPWMTARQAHDWLLFQPRFLDPPPAEDENPAADRYAAEVSTPDGAKFTVGDESFTQFLAQRYGRPLRLRFSERSMMDAAPISAIGLATVRALSEECGMELDSRRFRANFYVRWERDEPFFEDQLVGRAARIGEKVTVQFVKKDERCVMITLDPDSGAPLPVVLEKVTHQHERCLGVYGAVLREGIVRAGDPVYLM